MASISRRAAACAFAVAAAAAVTGPRAADLSLAPRSIVNQSGTTVESGGPRWLGTGANAEASRLGMIFTIPGLPQAALRSAKLVFTAAWTQWIPVDVRIGAELSGSPEDFDARALPSERPLTAHTARYAENSRWGASGAYEIDVTEPVRAFLARFAQPTAIALIAAGQGTPWGRKYFATGGTPPTLKLTFEDPPAPPPVAVDTSRRAPSASSAGAPVTATPTPAASLPAAPAPALASPSQHATIGAL